MILTSETGDGLGRSSTLEREVVKRLVRFYPSVHELYPSRAYLGIAPAPLQERDADLDGDGNRYEDYTNYEDFVNVLNRRYMVNPFQRPGDNNQRFHDCEGQDSWASTSYGVQYYHIYGQKENIEDTVLTYKISTVCRLRVLVCIRSDDVIEPVKHGYGDDTVPIESAKRSTASIAPGLIPIRANTGVGHNELLTNAEVYERVRQLLFPPAAGTAVEGAGEAIPDASLPPANAYYLTLSGVDTLTVTDAHGNSAAAVDGAISASSVSLTYQYLGARDHHLVLSETAPVTVTFQTTEAPVQIDLTRGSGSVALTAIRYLDLGLPLQVAVRLRLTPQGAEDLRYDGDGDGVFESIVQPTASVNDASAADMEAPIVKVAIGGPLDARTVTIEAVDAGAGGKRIYYSLDGVNFQVYTSPFIVDTTVWSAVYAFADDAVANRSGLLTQRLAQQVYLPVASGQ